MNNPFFNISDKNKDKLLKNLEANTINFKKNISILSNFKNENIIGIVVNGSVQIIRTDYNGNKNIIEELQKNSLFGTVFSHINDEYDIVTKEDSQIIIIEYDRIFEFDSTNPYYNQFIKNLLQITTNQIHNNNQRIQILTKKSIRNKLLEYFKIVSKKQGSRNIYLPFNFSDLADYLAVDRSAMSRELKNLKDEGFIEVKGKKITLLFSNQ